MEEYQFGDVVIIEFPFTDGSNTKKRPALVLFHDQHSSELLVARITSRIYQTDYDVEIEQWRQSNLLLRSCVRLSKLATLHTDILYKKLGELSESDIRNIKDVIKTSIQNL